MNKKILITGGLGTLDNGIAKFINSESDYEIVIVSGRKKNLEFNQNVKIINCSVLNFKEIRKICLDLKPDVIINLVALNDLEQCEKHKKFAWDFNFSSVENLLSISKIIGTHFITFSTENVFDGIKGTKGPYSESDKPNAVSCYGRTKLASENLCLTSYPKSTIIRLSTVYGATIFPGNDIVLSIILDLEDEKQISLIEGQYSTPTFMIDIARGVYKTIEKGVYGIYNFSGPDYLNVFQIGQKIANVFNFDKDNIKVFKPDANFNKIRQIEYGGLISLKAEAELGIRFSSLDNGLITVRHILNEKAAMFYKNE